MPSPTTERPIERLTLTASDEATVARLAASLLPLSSAQTVTLKTLLAGGAR